MVVVKPFLHSIAGSIYEVQATLQRDHDNAATDSSYKNADCKDETKDIKCRFIPVNHL